MHPSRGLNALTLCRKPLSLETGILIPLGLRQVPLYGRKRLERNLAQSQRY